MSKKVSQDWRLICDREYSGAHNMARDEALLLAQNENSAPILRFYNWSAPCVSIGRLQKNFDFDRAQPNTQQGGFEIVRRPTGGRAVLHQHEITYCAVLHSSHLPRESRSVVGAYNWLSTGFLTGLQTLGIRAQLGAAHAGSTPSLMAANCFGAAAQCDFLVGDKKLIGAAQCRKNDVILQHGAILLDIDEAAWHNAIGGAMNGAVSLRALGVLSKRDDVIAALVAGLESAWDIRFQNSVISASETALASRLHHQKYSTANWTRRAVTEKCDNQS